MESKQYIDEVLEHEVWQANIAKVVAKRHNWTVVFREDEPDWSGWDNYDVGYFEYDGALHFFRNLKDMWRYVVRHDQS